MTTSSAQDGAHGSIPEGTDALTRLIDHGVDTLEPGYAIASDELDAVAQAQGIEVRRGDAVLVRTGFLGLRRGRWGDYAGGDAPGISLFAAPWFYDNEVLRITAERSGHQMSQDRDTRGGPV